MEGYKDNFEFFSRFCCCAACGREFRDTELVAQNYCPSCEEERAAEAKVDEIKGKLPAFAVS